MDFSFFSAPLFYILAISSLLIGYYKMRANRKADYDERRANELGEEEYFSTDQNQSKTNNSKVLNFTFLQIGIYVAAFWFTGILSIIGLFIFHNIGGFFGFNTSKENQSLSS